MTPDVPALLLRYLDDRLAPEERRQVEDLLRASPPARALLRDLAEHAIAIADRERLADATSAAGAHPDPHAAPPAHPAPDHPRPVRFRLPAPFRFPFAFAASLLLLAIVAWRFAPSTPGPVARVTKCTGSSQYFGARHGTDGPLLDDLALLPGDTVETRSCDAWVELTLHDGTVLSLSGHSTLRILETEGGTNRFRLLSGHLWAAPIVHDPPARAPLAILTPSLAAETGLAQFDVHASPHETLLRVNRGTARVVSLSLSETPPVVLRAGHQLTADLRQPAALEPVPQPKPIHFWASHLWRVPEIAVGQWLPLEAAEPARLGAAPLLWPLSDTETVLLHAVAIAAWKSTDHPVVLRADSRLRFRGRTDRAQPVRFGFSTQRMKGVFSGKFEIDLAPHALAPPGQTWDTEIPLADFRPLQPHLAASPEGLELTDVYALTIQVDAGLELNHVELIPREASGLLPRR